MTDTTWETAAACREQDLSLWFPERDNGRDNHGRHAKSVCAGCPVLVACLEAALERGEEHGIWGGAGEDQRRDLNRAYTRRHQMPEGWAAKLDRHLRRLAGERMPVENRNGPNATDGLRVTYNRGCRCRACRWAAMDDVDERTHTEAPVGRLALVAVPEEQSELAAAWFGMLESEDGEVA